MPVKIEYKNKVAYTLHPCQFVDGHAYEDTAGRVFICNRLDDVVAFAISGTRVIVENDDVGLFREVDLKIIVEN